jgi:glycosyltransferase involved in cell wall biosynthesis
MSAIAILVPVLGRPQNAAPLVESITTATTTPHRILFLCSPEDDAEIEACEATGADVHIYSMRRGHGDYARKINHGYRLTSEPWIFQGADDLRFHPGWDVAALALAAQRPRLTVVGTNDLGNPRVRRGQLATHSLISRSYIDHQGASFDGPGVVLHEGYTHNYVDEELCLVARRRRVWGFARDAVVEHLHPHWGKANYDETYEIGLEPFHSDAQLFASRRRRRPQFA